MALKSIDVTGLYGVFNHRIPMDHAQGVTLLHGPNGFGKTVILKMIAAAFRSDLGIFTKAPFNKFEMTFDDGTKWAIQRLMAPDGGVKNPPPQLEIQRTSANGVVSTENIAYVDNLPRAMLDDIDRFVPSPYSRFLSGWRDSEGTRYSVNEILVMFPHAITAIPKALHSKLLTKEWGLPPTEVFVVEADRLRGSVAPEAEYRRNRYETEPEESRKITRVEEYSRDVVKRISSVLAAYAKSSQERDRTFPERLVQFFREGRSSLDGKTILEKMQALEKKRQRLISLGFLDSETGLRDLTEEEVRKAPEALTIYVQDVDTKLAAFDEMSRRVGKLIDIINDRFDYKQMEISRESGFKIIHDSEFPVALTDLSSGEQNELIVLYELLFMAPPNGLVLVDEPEISLHVAWQSRFLADLIEILKLSDSYALVATHSPVVIGNDWNLAVELTGPPKKKEAVRL